MKSLIAILSAGGLILLIGCAHQRRENNSAPLAIVHSAIAKSPNPKSGFILVKTLTDARSHTDKRAVGRLPWFFAPGADLYYVPADPLNANIILTEYFAEALDAAGYRFAIESPGAPASSN